MKCPKCGYIGFETTERCRNCGYDLTLTPAAAAAPDLPIRARDDVGGPLSDLTLSGNGPRSGEKTLDLDRMIGAPEPGADLPLFESEAGPELPPLVTPRATPRRPLAVRRPTPDPARIRPPRARETPAERAPTLDLPLPAEPRERPEPPIVVRERHEVRVPRTPEPHAPSGSLALASPALRIAAALIDVALLGAIDVLTLYFTLRLCGLSMHDWRVLPLIPLGTFFLIVNGGYLIAFTLAGGQTVGKMAFGLKVVAADDQAIGPGAAAMRALGCLASTLCLGAGLLPAFVDDERRALHDRLAATRVVRTVA